MTSCRTGTLLSILALGAALPLVPHAAAIAQIPLAISNDGAIVQVRINGEGPFPFIVQPSSEYTFIGTDLAERLALPTNDDAETPTVQLDTLQLGKLVFRKTSVHILDSQFIARATDGPQGILGWGVLAKYVWTLDFPGKQLAIERGRLTEDADGTTFAMALEKSTGPVDSGRAVTIPITIGDLTLAARIDSSSRWSLSLAEAYAEKLPLTSPPGLVARARTPAGEFDIKGAAVDATLHIGAHAVDRPRAFFSEMYEGAELGYDVLRQFAVTFDYPNRLVRLVRAKSNNDPQLIRATMVAEIDGQARLRKAFNADRGKVRLLMILSPT